MARKTKAASPEETRGESLVAVRRVYMDLSSSVDEKLTQAARAAGLSKKKFLESLILKSVR